MTLNNMNMTIEDLVACKPEAGSVPFFDGICWSYTMGYTPAQQILDCLIDESLTDYIITTTLSGMGNSLTLMAGVLNILYTGASLVGTVLGFGYQRFDLKPLLDTSYYISDGQNNYQIFNHQNLWRVGQDGLHFNVAVGNIEIGLPTPVAQYMTPGRCTAQDEFQAAYTGKVRNMAAEITIIALNGGASGNAILFFDGIKTVNEAIAEWNAAHTDNQIALTMGIGTEVPINKEEIHLVGGLDGISCLPGEYMPNNKWLVLTWDCITNQAQWMPPQCCLQTLSFSGCKLELSDGSRSNVNTHCGSCTAIPGPGDLGAEYLCGLNTDNQKLSLDIIPGTSELLCLTRRHGGTLGIQIPDPDSCVDLININEHTLGITDNYLSILGVDGHVNAIVDLTNANDHTLAAIVVDPIDPLAPQTPRPAILSILGSDGVENNNVNLMTVAREELIISETLICIQKQLQAIAQCNPCSKNKCIDLNAIQFDCSAASDCVLNTPIDWTVYPGICGIPFTDPVLEADWNNFFCNGPRTINEVNTFVDASIHNINNSLTIINGFIKRQKYRARITMRNPMSDISGHSNQIFWASHNDPDGGTDYDNAKNQRWFIPMFDEGRGRHSSLYSMVADPLGDGTLRPTHNNISISAGNTGTLAIPDASFSTTIGFDYNKATHSNNGVVTDMLGDPEDSQCSRFGGKTITCVKTGYYQVSLQGVIQADHSVKALRYACIRYNAATLKLDIIIDSKFGAGNVGSGSLNNLLIPSTNERHMGGTKIILLEKGDILFPAVKISPQTNRPKRDNPGGEATNDILYLLDSLGHPYGIHSPGSAFTGASGVGVSFGGSYTPGNLTYPNHPTTVTIPTNELARPTANLPNISPHFFSPTTGASLHGAGSYGYNLRFPGGGADVYTDYRRDDGCIVLYGPAGRDNSDGLGAAGGESQGASLAVHRVNAKQSDDPDYDPLPI